MKFATMMTMLAAAFAGRAEIDVVPYPSSVVEKPGAYKCFSSQDLRKVVKFSKDASISREGYKLVVTENGINVAASDARRCSARRSSRPASTPPRCSDIAGGRRVPRRLQMHSAEAERSFCFGGKDVYIFL